MRAFPSVVLLNLLLPIPGCGAGLDALSGPGLGGDGPIADGGSITDASHAVAFPAPHPMPPQVASSGGAVLIQPKIVPVFFSNDDPATTSQIKDFLSKLGRTNYWKETTQEYDGIGAATSTPPVELSEAAPAMIADTAIPTWLAAKLNGNDPAFPAPDENTVYVLNYPSTTTISLMTGRGTQQLCQGVGGYHADFALDARHKNLNVAYAVIPRCADFAGLTGIDAYTGTTSHELVEAATDPHPMNDPAYAQVDGDHFYWQFFLGGGTEVGDMCAQDPRAFTRFDELAYTVQRSWSNKAANAGHDPCVPALPGEVYFNTAPVLNDSVTITTRGGQMLTATGVQIPVGQSKTIDLDLFSDGDTGGPWSVKVQDGASLRGQPPTLSFALDHTSGMNGDKLRLTITVMAASLRRSGSFLITSKLGRTSNYWLGIVGQ